MSKRAISLVEVLISMMLISTVIVSMLQMKENNLNFLDKSQNILVDNSYISLVALGDDNGSPKDRSVYLDKEIDFKDDNIRKKFKIIKLNIENTELSSMKLGNSEYSLLVSIQKSTIKIKNGTTKQFYRFSLGNNE